MLNYAVVVVENCNGLNEESAGKTAEVAFFLLLYRKQLEIAGIGIKHIRGCSLASSFSTVTSLFPKVV